MSWEDKGFNRGIVDNTIPAKITQEDLITHLDEIFDDIKKNKTTYIISEDDTSIAVFKPV